MKTLTPPLPETTLPPLRPPTASPLLWDEGTLGRYAVETWTARAEPDRPFLVRARVSGGATLFVYDAEDRLVGKSRDDFGLCVAVERPAGREYLLVLVNLGRRPVEYELSAG